MRRAVRKFPPSHGNNVRSVGKLLPRTKFLPRDVAQQQAAVLRSVFSTVRGPGGRAMQVASPAKEQSKLTGQSERTCRNQQNGEHCMNLAEFFSTCHLSEEFQAWGAEMMGLEIVPIETVLARASAPHVTTSAPQEIRLAISVNGGQVVAQPADPTPPRDTYAVSDMFAGRH